MRRYKKKTSVGADLSRRRDVGSLPVRVIRATLNTILWLSQEALSQASGCRKGAIIFAMFVTKVGDTHPCKFPQKIYLYWRNFGYL